jgi:hypothetical protein
MITTLKWNTGQRFTAATKHLTPAVVIYKHQYSMSHVKAYPKIDSNFEHVKLSV